MKLEKLADVNYATMIGYNEIEFTDYGGIVGRNPDGTIAHIPRPSNNSNLLLDILGKIISDNQEVVLKDGYKLIIKDEVYTGKDLRTCVLNYLIRLYKNGKD